MHAFIRPEIQLKWVSLNSLNTWIAQVFKALASPSIFTKSLIPNRQLSTVEQPGPQELSTFVTYMLGNPAILISF